MLVLNVFKMPRWLTKASQALNRTTPAAPQPFELHCPCGAIIHGERRSRYQRVLCHQCGEPFFILPDDIYSPAPPRPVRGKSGKRRPARQKASAKKTGASHDAATRSPEPDTDPQVTELTADWELPPDREPKRRVITRVRLVLLGVVVLIAATASIIWKRHTLDQAELRFRQAAERGETALLAGDFEAADDEFQTASEALGLLQREGEEARRIRQWARESRAVSNLSAVSLWEIVEQAQELQAAGRAADWQRRFRLTYRNAWIVMQAPVWNRVDAEESAHAVVDCPMLVGNRPVVIQTDPAAFAPISLSREAQDVIFAAQLQDCRLRRSPGGAQWVIDLRPDTLFLWSDFANYRALGFGSGPAYSDNHTRQLLDRQTRLMKEDQ